MCDCVVTGTSAIDYPNTQQVYHYCHCHHHHCITDRGRNFGETDYCFKQREKGEGGGGQDKRKTFTSHQY